MSNFLSCRSKRKPTPSQKDSKLQNLQRWKYSKSHQEIGAHTVPLQSSCRTFFHSIIVYVASVCKRRATETRTELQFSLGNGCLDMSWVLMVWTPATTLWSSSATASFWSPSSLRTATLRVFSLIRSECVRFKWAPSAGNGRGWCTQILTTIMVWVAKGKSRGATMWRTSTRVNPPWD